MIRKFLQYNFGLGAAPKPPLEESVEEVTELGPAGRPPRRPKLSARTQMILAINWVMVLVFLVSFADVIAFSWLRPGASVPDLVKDLVSGTAGYFLSIVVAFARKP